MSRFTVTDEVWLFSSSKIVAFTVTLPFKLKNLLISLDTKSFLNDVIAMAVSIWCNENICIRLYIYQFRYRLATSDPKIRYICITYRIDCLVFQCNVFIRIRIEVFVVPRDSALFDLINLHGHHQSNCF